MGIEVSLLASIVAGAGAAAQVGQAIGQVGAAQAQNKALEVQRKQAEIKYQQETLANYALVQQVLDAQVASAGAKGFALSSPSFNAIQRDTYNKMTRAQSNIELEKDFTMANIDIEKKNVQNTLFAQLFGDVFKLASFGTEFYKNQPKKNP